MARIIALLFISLNLFIGTAFSAQDTDVAGIILNGDNQPINGASVYLMTSKTGIIIKTAVTNEQGVYTFVKAPKGEFYVEASSIGLAKGRSEIFTVGDVQVKVPNIILTTETRAIGEVVVQGQIPTISQQNGKLVMNVENSSIAAGNNALEIVKRAPGVSADQDDNLQLMGQSGINVTIDGRQTYMTGEQLTNFLKSTDGNQIKSVEVSTTRSAKDDAEGTAGTINIVMKKNKLEGFNGSFVASAGQGLFLRGNSSLALNYRKGNTTVFGNYGYTQLKQRFAIDLERNIVDDGVNTAFDQSSSITETNKIHDFRFGVEQKTSDRNTMAIQFTGNTNGEYGENGSVSYIGPQIGLVDSVLNSSAITDARFSRFSANFNNEFRIDTNGRKLTFDFDWGAFRNNAHTDYENKTYDASYTDLLYAPELQRSGMPVNIDIIATKLDYTQKLGKKGVLETGLKYSNVKSDNDISFENFISDSWVNDVNRTNHFVYTEEIAAAYLDYAGTFGKWGIKAGLRGEYTMSDGNSITQANRVAREYFDLFPSASLSYNLNENHVLSLSYAKKIQRPNYRKLNPFEYFIDKFTSERGNAYLQPQYTDSYALNYTLFKMFNITAGYNYTYDAIVESMGQDSVAKTTWVTNENLGKVHNGFLNINAPARIGKFWSMNNNITAVYMYFDGVIAGTPLKNDTYMFQGTSMNTFKITKPLSAELVARYTSPFLYNIYTLETRWNVDLGTTYNFKDQRSSLKLAVTDVFKTNRTRLHTDFADFSTKISQYNDAQTVRLTFTYKFGNMKQNISKKNTDNDEKSRAL
ncbi:TonB-dependent receptor domain-containing protein [Sphingobacterium hungaricum]